MVWKPGNGRAMGRDWARTRQGRGRAQDRPVQAIGEDRQRPEERPPDVRVERVVPERSQILSQRVRFADEGVVDDERAVVPDEGPVDRLPVDPCHDDQQGRDQYGGADRGRFAREGFARLHGLTVSSCRGDAAGWTRRVRGQKVTAPRPPLHVASNEKSPRRVQWD